MPPSLMASVPIGLADPALFPLSEPGAPPVTTAFLVRRLRPLIATVRGSLVELDGATGQETLDRFFTLAPLEPSLAIASMWGQALAAGHDVEGLRDSFTPGEQLALDLVVAFYPAYTTGHTGVADLLIFDDE